MSTPVPHPTRATYLSHPALFLLRNAAQIPAAAFGETAYLVGSSLHHKHYRDVDVRIMLEADRWEQLFGQAGADHPLWLLLCNTVSEHLSRLSGLPVDFQLQLVDEANAHHAGRRNALLPYEAAQWPYEAGR